MSESLEVPVLAAINGELDPDHVVQIDDRRPTNAPGRHGSEMVWAVDRSTPAEPRES